VSNHRAIAMAPNLGRLAMLRLLSKRQVRDRVLYSFAHIDRLEKAGLFPKRVRLGQGRVGWVEEEVLEWLRRKIEARDSSPSGASV
jgi:prophage regulatory protein